jgi:hypothetical protein
LKGDPIPPDDHLAIHCQPAHYLERDEGGKPVSVSLDVFRVDEEGISSNWIEFEGDDFDEQFAKACLLLTTVRTVRSSHCVGILVVADVLAAGTGHRKVLNVIHDPIEAPPPNPGHALITGVAPTDKTLLYELSVITALHPFTAEALQRSKEAEVAKKRDT